MPLCCINYRNIKGYRYQTMAPIEIDVSNYFPTENMCIDGFICLEGGLLKLNKGYAWDGPSGPVIHTKNWIKPSLAHDAMYQLIRNRCFKDIESARKKSDDLMYKLLLDGGMSRLRSWYSYKAVRIFGKNAIKSETNKKPTLKICHINHQKQGI